MNCLLETNIGFSSFRTLRALNGNLTKRATFSGLSVFTAVWKSLKKKAKLLSSAHCACADNARKSPMHKKITLFKKLNLTFWATVSQQFPMKLTETQTPLFHQFLGL